MIAKEAQGFLYCVSSLGVTGVRKEIKTDINGMIKLVKEVSDVPCAVGFGISTPKQAEDVCKYADGAIVGSAIVRIVAEHRQRKRALRFTVCKRNERCCKRLIFC